METPVFEEFAPANDCDCPACTRPFSNSTGTGISITPRDAFVVAAAATVALGATPAIPAVAAHAPPPPPHPSRPLPGTPSTDDPAGQGEPGPLRGPDGAPLAPAAETPVVTRADIIARARTWVTAQVPYSTTAYWSDGYRQDCSGFVSMAWNLGTNEWTGSLASFGVRVTKDQLRPGDILLRHNSADPAGGSHVVLFGGWTDPAHTHYTAYEQTPPHTRKQTTPYAYWSNARHYVPYRHRGLAVGSRTAASLATQGTRHADEYERIGAPRTSPTPRTRRAR